MPVPAGGAGGVDDTLLITAEELGRPDLELAAAERAIRTASAYVESKTGMAFTTRTATVRLPSSAAFEMPFPLKPLRSVQAVTIAGRSYTDHTVTANGTLWRARGWRTSFAPETVEITATYGMSAVPEGIKGAVIELAGAIADGRLGVSSERLDDYQVAYTGILSEPSRAALVAYGADVAAVPFTGR